MNKHASIAGFSSLLVVLACGGKPPEAPAEAAPPPAVVEPPQPSVESLLERVKASNGKDAEAASLLKQRVTHASVPLLVDALGTGYPDREAVLVDALKQVVSDADRRLVVDAYKTKLSLIHLVRMHHWEPDIKDVLVEQLGNTTRFIPIECVETLAQFRDPETYPALKSYFVNGWNRHVTYDAISLLPGIDLTRELPLAWEKAVASSNKWEAAYLIPPLLEAGYLPAMAFVMDNLRQPSDVPITVLDSDALSSRYLDQSGTAAEKLQWWDSNKKKLRFDKKRLKFAR